jgi:hypothetical protein
MGLWKQHFHWSVLLDWVVLAVTVPTILAVAGLLLFFDQYDGANVCFVLASLFVFAKIVHVAVVSSDAVTSRVVFTFLLFGVVGVAIVETVKGVEKWKLAKENTSLPVEQKWPELTVKITTVKLAPAGDGSDLVIFAIGAITNHGAPGAVDDFKMDLEFENSRVIHGQFPVVPNIDQIFTFDKKPGFPALAVNGSTYWARTARLQPVPNNVSLDGWLSAVFSGVTLKEAVEHKATIVLSGTDMHQKTFSAKWKLGTDHANEKEFTMDQIQKPLADKSKVLEKNALLLVQRIRKSLADNAAEDEKINEEWRQKLADKSVTVQQSDAAFRDMTGKMMALTGSTMRNYDEHIKVDAIILRDKILEKLPPGSRDGSVDYERPTNPLGLERVASDLERIAKLLSY